MICPFGKVVSIFSVQELFDFDIGNKKVMICNAGEQEIDMEIETMVTCLMQISGARFRRSIRCIR